LPGLWGSISSLKFLDTGPSVCVTGDVCSKTMPVFALEIKATLENISKLTPLPGNLWKFDIANSASERKEGVTVGSDDEIPLEGSRGSANYVMHWSGTK
jgi:hypothetical protein